MKKTAVFLSFILVVGFAYANAISIRGTITNLDSGTPIPGATITEKGTTNSAISDSDGKYKIIVTSESSILAIACPGHVTEEIRVGKKHIIDVKMSPKSMVEVADEVMLDLEAETGRHFVRTSKMESKAMALPGQGHMITDYTAPPFNTEGYATIHENEFLKAIKNPLSTFSIDVDVASYANMRRFINNGQKPPVDAVRIEEMINYFNYDYDGPKGDDPFSINMEMASCPWNEAHKLVHIGLQGKEIPTDNLPPSNLVFLIDVSGSMQSPQKLPLLKSVFKMLVEKMRNEDRVAIVVYAGAAGLVLPSTPGSRKTMIMEALDKLTAGGSTAGGAGIKLAYDIAMENFVKDGNNRIILATDGDFNVGASSNAEMERLIEKKRDQGIFLTVAGFGMGNYKDDKMEILANKGNGNYAYIDNMQEAKKVFVSEFGGTLFTIAKDVKIQIEFNPALVQAYRLIGYENRILKDEDFNNDKKDAGELGSGHTVTALYEIIPVGVNSEFVNSVDPLKYQKNEVQKVSNISKELMTLKFRYKDPDGNKSKLITTTLTDKSKDWKKASENFRWSAAVAGFGMLLRESEFAQGTDIASVLELAKGARGTDEAGYRSEFIRLVESSQFLASGK